MATSFEARRRQNTRNNAALVKELGLTAAEEKRQALVQRQQQEQSNSAKRRKITAQTREPARPTRASARIAEVASRPTYNDNNENNESKGDGSYENEDEDARPTKSTKRQKKSSSASKRTKPRRNQPLPSPSASPTAPSRDLTDLMASWSSWKPYTHGTAEDPTPTQDTITGAYHFTTHPIFTPNKSPESILREGCFGGSYFRPLYSRHLRATIRDDYLDLPPSWTKGLNIEKYLTSPDYDAEVNKYGVACGQSIEEWEAAGWIDHRHDVRGWFQWYCRFWMGRRCEDDERQIGRWRKCVGETGRWRRILLKKYVTEGVRSVGDEGLDGEEGGGNDVSPVVHQTCHHWGYEVRQDALDQFWREGK